MAFTKDIGLLDFYKFYVESSTKKNKPYEDYKTFSKVIKAFNFKLREKIIYEAEKVSLPYRLGDIYVKKFNTNRKLDDMKTWKVNYKATKELGKVIYHDDEYGYKWQWVKSKCLIPGRRYYQFKPSRTASRLITDAIKNKNLDFYR